MSAQAGVAPGRHVPVLERLRNKVTANAPPAGPARPWRLLAAACLALAVLSLLLPSEPTYDPWAWIIWGREIVHLDLVTTTGPSWKPLPVLFTAPFALLGDAVAPEAWLVIARAGGLLAFAMAYRLGARLAGPLAGSLAAAALVLTDEFIRNFARGNSEGLLVALCLWAVERHLDGRRRDAFLLGFAAALLRPEVWPFWGLYGLWLLAGAWRPQRPPWRQAAVLTGSVVLLALLWFVPEWIGSGSPLRAAERARDPNPDSAAFAASPFLEVFRRSGSVLEPPVFLGALIAVAAALESWRRSRAGGLRLALFAVATVLMVAVAAMTEAGFAGNLRYVALPAALVCILAGAGWVELGRRVRRRWGTFAALAFSTLAAAGAAPFVVADAGELSDGMQSVNSEADFYAALPAAIAKAGGAAAVKACGSVVTGPFQVQRLAWQLRVHGADLTIFPFPPATTIAPRSSSLAVDPRFPKITETRKWIVGSSCRRR